MSDTHARRVQFVSSPEWASAVRSLIRSEMQKKGVDYAQLSDHLSTIGTLQTADNLRQKINKGILGAQLLLQILYVLKVRKVSWELIEELVEAASSREDA
ncbi:MAG: DUF6471 domain-containing protein [Motiliproteus sp.]